MISEGTYKIVKENATILDSAIIYDRDFNYNLCVLFSIARRSVIYPPYSALVSKLSSDRTC
jgi:hypothetical protein